MNDVKEFVTVRLVFSKHGRARYISHLDLNRTMTRAVRRAGLPIWYTEGFNKHPYLTFAAPLSLGFEGERETMDVRLLCNDLPMDELVRRLDAVMPEGLRILSAAPAVHKAGEVAASVYRLTLACTTDEVAAFRAQKTITAERRNKKKQLVTVDLKPILDGITTQPMPCDGGVQWTLTLPSGSEQSVNPSLVVAALRAFIGREAACRICRVSVLTRDGEEFL